MMQIPPQLSFVFILKRNLASLSSHLRLMIWISLSLKQKKFILKRNLAYLWSYYPFMIWIFWILICAQGRSPSKTRLKKWTLSIRHQEGAKSTSFYGCSVAKVKSEWGIILRKGSSVEYRVDSFEAGIGNLCKCKICSPSSTCSFDAFHTKAEFKIWWPQLWQI